MDWSTLLQGVMQGFNQQVNRTKKTGRGLFDRLMGGGDAQGSRGYSSLRPSETPSNSENMDEPYLAALGSDYPEGEEAPIPRMPRTRAMEPIGIGDLLGAGGVSTPEEVELIRRKERILRQLLRGGDLQYGPMR